MIVYNYSYTLYVISIMGIKRVWNDPVWSKVISSIIILILTSVCAIVKSYVDNTGIIDVVLSVGWKQIKLWHIVLVVVICLIGYGLYSKHKLSKQFRYDQHSYNSDKELYDSILKDLTPNGSIYFLRTNNFAGFSFHLSSLDELEDFYHKYSSDPRFEFFHPDIEKKLRTLLSDIDHFEDVICVNTFPGNRDDLQFVPPEWEEKDPKHFWKVVNSIHAAAQQVCIDYDDFVKFGKREIKI